MSKSRNKKKMDVMAEKIHIESESIFGAFQRLIQSHKHNAPWRFTYSVSLSAEPIAEAIQEVKLPKREVKNK